jgi:hypothetical protein
MLEHGASPTLSDDHEVRLLSPKTSAELNEEWIGIVLNHIGIPVAIVLISDHNLSIHDLLCCVSSLPIDIISVELLQVKLINLRPSLSIVKMDSIDAGG